MRYPGFCGGSNQLQSPYADLQRTVNWIYEPVQAEGAPVDGALFPVPGFSTFIAAPQITATGARGGIVASERAFVVVAGDFYELFANRTAIKRGTVAQDAYPATLSYNGVAGGQIWITSGNNGYTYDLATNTLTLVLTGECTMGGMLSARFLCFNKATGRVRMSNQNDGLTWDPTLFFARTLAADPWQSMRVSGSNIWLIGSETGEVWYDSGAFPQPFAPISGASFPYGTPAPFSCDVVGDYVTWLAQNAAGLTTVVAARGYAPSEISSFAVGTALSRYRRNGTLNDAEVFSYGDDNHLFACFQFPTAPATWVFDFKTGAWSERGSWNAPLNRFDAWTPRIHIAAFGKHLFGARGLGAIAQLDPSVGAEADGSPIRRLRIGAPLLASTRQRIAVDRFQVYIEPGLGTVAGQGVDPRVMLRISYDGRTWGHEWQAQAGAMGEYRRRVVFNRCGSSEQLWVPELTCTDPVPWRVTGAEIDGTGLPRQARAA